jgi:hypothetical protein
MCSLLLLLLMLLLMLPLLLLLMPMLLLSDVLTLSSISTSPKVTGYQLPLQRRATAWCSHALPATTPGRAVHPFYYLQRKHTNFQY